MKWAERFRWSVRKRADPMVLRSSCAQEGFTGREQGRASLHTPHNLPMCGRYRLSRRKQLVEEYFDSVSSEEDWSPRYNIAPTQPVPVIRQNSKEPCRELSVMRWGLIP